MNAFVKRKINGPQMRIQEIQVHDFDYNGEN